MEHMAVLYFVTQEDYNKIENEDLSLQQGEAAIFEDHCPQDTRRNEPER